MLFRSKIQWEEKLFDYQRGAQQTSGPIIANGKIISGRGCEPEGSPAACVIMAHDAKTGSELWRRRTIVAPNEAGGDSWGNLPDEERWHVGSWLVPSFDPELNLVFAGTSVTSPAPKFALAGNEKKYLYHNSTLALNADTGEIVWCCLPRFDSEPVFSSLLDEEQGGKFRIASAHGELGSLRYLPNTNIAETTFHTPSEIGRAHV